MPLKNVHDTTDGNISGAVQQRPTSVSSTVPIVDYSDIPGIDQLNQRKELPAANPYSGSINWLGSSYSGVDIKVVAHMHIKGDLGDRIKEILSEKSVADGVVTGINNLMDFPDGLNSPDLDSFKVATGLSSSPIEEEQRALRILVSELYSGFRSPAQRNLMSISAAVRLKTVYHRISEDLQDQINQIHEAENDAQKTVVLGTLQTLSVQTFREKFAVRALGHSYAKGYSRGPRTVAGTMVFTIFDQHALATLTLAMAREGIWKEPELSTYIPDQLPPLDMTIVFANEYGSISEMRIYGVEFINDGSVFSIEDLMSENVISFTARDVDTMTKVGKVRLNRNQRGFWRDEDIGDRASSLSLNNNKYEEYLGRLGLKRRRVVR